MTDKLIIPAGIIGFVLLCVACVLSHTRVIERDLMSRSTLALAAAGVPNVELTFSGRDATLHGTVDSRERRLRAEQAVARQHGVRKVNNQLQIAGMPDPDVRSDTEH